jgi:hypothetical protein
MWVLLPIQEAVLVWDLQNPMVWISIVEVRVREKRAKGFAPLVLETNDSIPNIESVEQLLMLQLLEVELFSYNLSLL